MRNYWSVDRVEGVFAVCEDDAGAIRKFLLKNIPFPISEGSVFYEENRLLVRDIQEEKKRKYDAKGLADSLFDKGE